MSYFFVLHALYDLTAFFTTSMLVSIDQSLGVRFSAAIVGVPRFLISAAPCIVPMLRTKYI